MIRIEWQNIQTGATGHGEWQDDSQRKLLDDWMLRASERNPLCRHWIAEESGSIAGEKHVDR